MKSLFDDFLNQTQLNLEFIYTIYLKKFARIYRISSTMQTLSLPHLNLCY